MIPRVIYKIVVFYINNGEKSEKQYIKITKEIAIHYTYMCNVNKYGDAHH